MSESGNSALARRWFEEVWNDRREETVRELMAPDVEGHLEGGLEVRRPGDFLAARTGLLEAFPDFGVTVEAVIAQGDDVAVRWSASGTHRGESLGFPASNRPAAFRGITWLTFRNGKIAKGWDAWNQGRLIQELQGP
jgi:steroid delta-isomerase-like uncharacterized protein